jgi:hypothetical protein
MRYVRQFRAGSGAAVSSGLRRGVASALWREVSLAHVGAVVPTLEAGRDRLSKLLGIEWGPISEDQLPSGRVALVSV